MAGWLKYGVCLAIGAISGLLAWSLSPWFATPAAVVGFYVAEARSVFLVPLLADFGPRGRRAMPALVRRAGGTARIMATVMPIAGTMLFGGLHGQGLIRPWLRGCAAIAIWYDDLKKRNGGAAPLLDIGARAELGVRCLRVSSRTPGRRVRLLYASDLHLGAYAARSAGRDLLRIVIRERPDVLVLGGDLVDSARGLRALEHTLNQLALWAPLVAVPGNHDMLAGIERVRASVEAAGGHWLSETPLTIEGIQLHAAPQRCLENRGRYRILCAHDPAVFDAARIAAHDLVLAGHLHGGQIVLARHRGRDFPAAWFYRWNGPRFTEGSTTMLVSRGCADTLPIRFRCPREVLLCDIH